MIQDDARLHIVWLQQFVDPDLFPNDLIAQYYQTIQAIGFKGFYWLMAKLGIAPLLLAKLLPVGLALVMTIYLFYFTLELLPSPACGFWTTLLLNQNIWLKDDLISATPRAFVYPLLAAFLYYLVRRSFYGSLSLIGLMGLFYPQVAIVELGILTLRLFTPQRHTRLWLAAIGVLIVTIWPYQQMIAHQFGEILSAAQMQQMPEFGPDGRRQYFGVDPISFLFRGASGLRFPLFPPILWVSLALPLWLRSRNPTVLTIRPTVRLLGEVMLVSIGLFFLAHLLFPKLYLPSRYTFYSSRIVMAVAAGMVIFLSLKAGWQWWRQLQPSLKARIGAGLMGLVILAVVAVPAVPRLFLAGQGWIQGEQPLLYRYLANQPKGTLVASLASEADNIPAFAQRSVLVSRELALAYHPQFYAVMQQRMIDLLQAHYSPNLIDLQTRLQHYGIDFLILDRSFTDPDYLSQQDWLIHSSFQQHVLEVKTNLHQGMIPALSQVIDRCTLLSENNLSILEASCINKIQSK